MPIHTLECPSCGHELVDYSLPHWPDAPIPCRECGNPYQIVWSVTCRRAATVHPKERAVVWYNPTTGEHKTPGRNDVPMPARYAERGYERHEFDSLPKLDRFCGKRNLINEKAHYDNNGKSFDL